MRPYFAFMSLLVAVLVTSTPVLAQIVDAPVIQVGDTWEYESTDDWTSQVRVQERQEVIGLMQDFVRLRTESRLRNLKTQAMESRGIEEETQRADMNVDLPVRDDRVARRMNYAWPLEVGKKWNYEYTVTSMGANGQAVFALNRIAAEVVGWENVTTPAGTFRSLKVVHKGTVEYSGYPSASRVGWVLWYAPAIGTQVKYTYQWDSASGAPGTRTTTLLTSYKRGKN